MDIRSTRNSKRAFQFESPGGYLPTVSSEPLWSDHKSAAPRTGNGSAASRMAARLTTSDYGCRTGTRGDSVGSGLRYVAFGLGTEKDRGTRAFARRARALAARFCRLVWTGICSSGIE